MFSIGQVPAIRQRIGMSVNTCRSYICMFMHLITKAENGTAVFRRSSKNETKDRIGGQPELREDNAVQ